MIFDKREKKKDHNDLLKILFKLIFKHKELFLLFKEIINKKKYSKTK